VTLAKSQSDEVHSQLTSFFTASTMVRYMI
jgi:hypothetical protein